MTTEFQTAFDRAVKGDKQDHTLHVWMDGRYYTITFTTRTDAEAHMAQFGSMPPDPEDDSFCYAALMLTDSGGGICLYNARFLCHRESARSLATPSNPTLRRSVIALNGPNV